MAKHWRGGAPIPWLETLERRELLRWYAVYERQTVEQQITNEFLYPKDGGKAKSLPAPSRMAQLVDTRIAENRNGGEGK